MTIQLSSPVRQPAQPLPEARWTMKFHVSLNEEHVFIALHEGVAPPLDLGERVHHYCLLVLARLRVADAARGIDGSSQGWVDVQQLARMLGLDVAHLNIQLFRARRQIQEVLPAGLADAQVVERRRGEVRFGGFGIEVVRGAQLEAQLQRPAAVSAGNAV